MTRSSRSCRQVRRRVFIPFGAALLGMLAASCFAVLWQKTRCVSGKLDTRLAVVTQMFQAGIEEEAEMMRGLIDSLEKDAKIQEAWLAADREKLLEVSLPHFEEISSEYRVTRFNFHDLEMVCFLRNHRPSWFGDASDRSILKEAARTGGTTHGMELGPLGTCMLRVVHPWRVDGRLVGYIELGKRVDHIATEMREVLGADLFFAVDKSYLERANLDAGLSMMGHTQVWGSADSFIFVDHTRKDVSPKIIRHLNAAHSKHGDWEFEFSEGSRMYRCGVVQLVEADGRAMGSIVSLLDITESVKGVNELLVILTASGVLLAGLIGAFFWSYLGRVQRDVAHAQDELQISLNREKAFADDVAHELRTPLAGMRSIIDVALLCDRPADEMRESLDDCSSIVRNMESLVGKLLMLARLDGKRITFHKEAVGLAEVIDDCWEPLREQAAARGLTFENRVSSELDCVSDRVGLGIIFSNLLENSAEYANKKGQIWVTAEEKSKDAVRVAVANTGCPLKEADAAMVFQPFWRADSSRGGDGRHAGLGLSLARRLVSALGGDASAEVDEQGVFTVRVVLGESSVT